MHSESGLREAASQPNTYQVVLGEADPDDWPRCQGSRCQARRIRPFPNGLPTYPLSTTIASRLTAN